MARIVSSVTSSYSIHEDGWTETLASITFLISKIEEIENEGDTFHSVLLLRLVYISACYLSEQMFSQTTSKYIEEKLDNFGESDDEIIKKEQFEMLTSDMSLRQVGISKAMKEWPQLLTGTKLNFGEGALQSLREITKKRNDLVHKLNDLTLYLNPSEISKQILYTTTESCKLIEKHFFPTKEFKYKDWLETYPPIKTDYYKKI